MGLNLNIGRIVFSTLKKFDGQKERFLTFAEIRQIAGRAGALLGFECQSNNLFPQF